MKNNGISIRLIIMNFLQYAIWGAYLTSMGSYLVNIGLGAKIGIFYAMQGIVSIFMPAIIGIIADKYIQAQKVLGLCHGIAGLAMIAAGYYGLVAGDSVLPLLDKRGILHAYHRALKFRSLLRTREIRHGHREGFSAYQGFRYCRFHLQHALRELHVNRRSTVPIVL